MVVLHHDGALAKANVMEQVLHGGWGWDFLRPAVDDELHAVEGREKG
jgi:hypothetical protein